MQGALTHVTLPNSVEIDYVTDAEGRRVGKKVNSVLVQGWIYAGGLAPIAETDGAGTITTRYVYGTRVNVPEYLVRGGSTYRIVTDHLGSVRMVVDSADGTVVQRIDYDAFGRITLDTNPGWQPFGFAGGLFEPQTGLVRFGARDYDPETGRWTAKDPIGFAGGSAGLYEYCANDPVNRVDPTGTFDLADTPEWLDEGLVVLSDFSAGFGDIVSFGGTRWARRLLGTSGAVNESSIANNIGEVTGVAHGLAMGGLHLGRNVVAQMGRQGGLATRIGRGVSRLAYDNRKWGSVRSTWSRAMGGLASRGQSLHHLGFPQRANRIVQGIRNAGFNYLPISARLNSWMNGKSASAIAVEWTLKFVVAGSEAAPITAALNED